MTTSSGIWATEFFSMMGSGTYMLLMNLPPRWTTRSVSSSGTRTPSTTGAFLTALARLGKSCLTFLKIMSERHVKLYIVGFVVADNTCWFQILGYSCQICSLNYLALSDHEKHVDLWTQQILEEGQDVISYFLFE